MHGPDLIADAACSLKGDESDRPLFKIIYGVDVTKVERLGKSYSFS